MIVAGEPSGDAHAAALVQALKKKTRIESFGATGPLMRAEGVETVVNSDELAIMGIIEVAQVFPKFIAAFRALKAAAIDAPKATPSACPTGGPRLKIPSAVPRRPGGK